MNKCIYSEACGGCKYQGISYKKQLEIKNKQIDSLLSSFATPKPILGMKDPSSYRNKVQVTFGKDDNNHIVYGNYVENSHIIVPIKTCAICDKDAMNIIQTIYNLIKKYKISIFDEHTYRGCLRHVLIRTNHNNEHMVVLVTGLMRFPKRNSFISDLLKKHRNIKTVVQCINERRTSSVLGNKSYVLYGEGYLQDKLCGNLYNLGFNSFYQVNKTMTKVLYKTAIDYANLKDNDVVLDAYCGIGTISLALARKCKKVVGVEINKNAIKDAIVNKKVNSINNAYFIAEDATKYILKEDKDRFDVVFADPPRSGCDNIFLKALLKMKPKTIIYISCNPYTLKNDLNLLCKKNLYKVSDIQPVDMFPYTEHVECVAKLQRIY